MPKNYLLTCKELQLLYLPGGKISVFVYEIVFEHLWAMYFINARIAKVEVCLWFTADKS